MCRKFRACLRLTEKWLNPNRIRRSQVSRTKVKTGFEEESELSISTESEKNGAIKQEVPEVVTAKTTKKRKTKADKEAEAMPLRPRTQGLRMFVGAHVSAAKGVFNAVNNSMQIGGNAFALFLKSQRKWDNPALQDDHRDQFCQSCSEQEYNAAKHVLPHGSYLVNLAQEDNAKAKQAYNSFLDDLQRCEALGINLYNFHPGSAGQTTLPSALTRLAKALTNALAATSTVTPVLETMCGQGTTIGGSLNEFRDIIAQIPKEHHSRIGICIDTCHSHAAGYDLASPTGFKAFLKEFDEVIGLQFLRALHLNDSKTPRGSHRDLHANIGTGFLGLRAFHNIMNEPTFEDMPMILETPIDRPVSNASRPPTTDTSSATAAHEACASEDSESDLSEPEKPTKKSKAKAKKPTARLIADPSVWANEISLLESLIGMDPESLEFRSLEANLADEGREMREKHQEQHDRKVEAEEKKKKKAAEKGQKSLMDMMKGSSAGKGKKKTADP
ncbi:DNA-(apurinic or apyrimidinic site) lyase APN1 [Aspergillus ruber CBS 135680]|uniref:Apurinic-apyrimidinic endonuclease 1 n=1 Tax=Aspergillus ruber (strain CBS 135680) TaxID=1388766 RepID=A0A017SEB5_ASPRC|nr:AP endonuclease [Aspergillus ruber CBS 135680]EYE95101.1 AP endonuclease [Aspergillus ruber CBS 135680]